QTQSGRADRPLGRQPSASPCVMSDQGSRKHLRHIHSCPRDSRSARSVPALYPSTPDLRKGSRAPARPRTVWGHAAQIAAQSTSTVGRQCGRWHGLPAQRGCRFTGGHSMAMGRYRRLRFRPLALSITLFAGTLAGGVGPGLKPAAAALTDPHSVPATTGLSLASASASAALTGTPVVATALTTPTE